MENQEESKRYIRQVMLPEFGPAGQEKLKQAKVLVIGAGGLGCPILQYLAAAGVGHLGIIDNDQVSLSNLHRQILYHAGDIGKNKASKAAERIAVINPYVKAVPHCVRLGEPNAKALFEGYDLVIDGSDNFSTRYLVNDTCVALGIPLIFGSILKFEGQVSVFNYQDGPEYRDLFPEAPPADEVPNCSDIGVIGILPGLIGMYMANEAIKVICGIGQTLSGKLLVLDTLSNSNLVFDIPRKKKKGTPIIHQAPLEYHEINHSSYLTMLEADPEGIAIVDVREEVEFQRYNMGGINIPLQELADRMDEVPIDKPLLVCCQSGIRSQSAANLLSRHFSQDVYSLIGGLSQVPEDFLEG